MINCSQSRCSTALAVLTALVMPSFEHLCPTPLWAAFGHSCAAVDS